MRMFQKVALVALFTLWPMAGFACTTPVCPTDYNALGLTRIITFDDQAAAAGPGRKLDDILIIEGAQFGEHFAGQALETDGDHDVIRGLALPPLSVRAGRESESLGLQKLFSTNVLLGYGPRRHPHREASGEGAIAVVFDHDQQAFGFRLYGGEDGVATISFFRRDGQLIGALTLTPLGENRLGFRRRSDIADIAGFVIDNRDPEGIAIDDLIFDGDVQIGRAPLAAPRGWPISG